MYNVALYGTYQSEDTRYLEAIQDISERQRIFE